jgi:hypothetical protein
MDGDREHGGDQPVAAAHAVGPGLFTTEGAEIAEKKPQVSGAAGRRSFDSGLRSATILLWSDHSEFRSLP